MEAIETKVNGVDLECDACGYRILESSFDTAETVHEGAAALPGETVSHNLVFARLLKSIDVVDFHELLSLEPNKSLRQKHFIYGVVKYVLQQADKLKLQICMLNENLYTYNGEYWRLCNRSEIGPFLAAAAIKMGLKDYDARYIDFKDKLVKQFWT